MARRFNPGRIFSRGMLKQKTDLKYVIEIQIEVSGLILISWCEAVLLQLYNIQYMCYMLYYSSTSGCKCVINSFSAAFELQYLQTALCCYLQKISVPSLWESVYRKNRSTCRRDKFARVNSKLGLKMKAVQYSRYIAITVFLGWKQLFKMSQVI